TRQVAPRTCQVDQSADYKVVISNFDEADGVGSVSLPNSCVLSILDDDDGASELSLVESQHTCFPDVVGDREISHVLNGAIGRNRGTGVAIERLQAHRRFRDSDLPPAGRLTKRRSAAWQLCSCLAASDFRDGTRGSRAQTRGPV